MRIWKLNQNSEILKFRQLKIQEFDNQALKIEEFENRIIRKL